jgi:hypothetical protein
VVVVEVVEAVVAVVAAEARRGAADRWKGFHLRLRIR